MVETRDYGARRDPRAADGRCGASAGAKTLATHVVSWLGDLLKRRELRPTFSHWLDS